MEKKEIVLQLRKAKTAHIRWRSYAQALISGVPMDEGKVPVVHTDCEFGHWYFGDGQALSALPAFVAINGPHEQLHALYMEIFKHLFEEENVGVFGRLVGRKAKNIEKRRVIVQSLMDELLRTSEKLLGYIDELEKAVQAMSEEELAALY